MSKYNPNPFSGGGTPGNHWEEDSCLTQRQLKAYEVVYNALAALHNQDSPEKRLYNVNEVCRALNLTKGTVIKLIQEGKLYGLKTSTAPNSPYKIPFQSIIKYILNVNRR